MRLNLPYLDMVFSRLPKYNRRFLKVFYFSLWSPSVFFPGEISPFFNKEIGKFLENFLFLALIRIILVKFLLNCNKILISKEKKKKHGSGL
jgi:hypothetical protein